MIVSPLTSKAQTTIPQPVRVALGLREGDMIAYRATRQRRPALVIGVPPGGPVDMLWVLMITNTVHRGWLGDIEIESLADAGLPAASIVRTAKLATIDASAAERLGRLPGGAARHQVIHHFHKVLAVAAEQIAAL
jgi:mRNA interferase MazF